MTTKNEMKWSGVGPRLALTTLPFIMLAIIFKIKEPNFLVMDFLNELIAKIIGFSWLAIGIVFYLISAKTYFKVLIQEEYVNLKKIFGDEYDRYEKKVNEIFPIPKFWK